MKTLIIDNYDSFTYNLFQYIGELNGNPVVFENDKINLQQIEDLKTTHIVISAGPGTVEDREDFGICYEVIKTFMNRVPLLGVCLGHQGIVKTLGGQIEHAPTVMHGKQSSIEHQESAIFKNVPNLFSAMRYHSLCASPENFPNELKITAKSKDDNIIMAVEHCSYPLFGIQFHPESFGTEVGKTILKNFLSI